MDIFLFIVLIIFVCFGLTLIFLGIRSSKKKRRKAKNKELEYLRNQTTKKAEKVKGGKYLTNKIIVSADVSKMQYQGSTPFIEIDENWQQMPLDRTVLTIAREVLTRMFPLAYLAGKLSVMEQAGKVGLVMILLFLLIIGNLILTYWKTDSNAVAITSVQESSTNNHNDLKNSISNQNLLIQLIAEKFNITSNITVPTVGG